MAKLPAVSTPEPLLKEEEEEVAKICSSRQAAPTWQEFLK